MHLKILAVPTFRTHYIQLWEKRCRFLCCLTSRDENSSEAFKNVAGMANVEDSIWRVLQDPSMLLELLVFLGQRMKD